MTTYLFEFMLQFLLAEFVFAKGMPRRKHFTKRIIGFGISLTGIMYGLTCLQLVFPFQQYYLHFLFLMLPLAFAYAWLCFDVRLFSALYIFSGGYCIQHISSNLYTLSSYFISMDCRDTLAADTECGNCLPACIMCLINVY